MTVTNFVMGSNQTYTGETFINPYTMAAGSNNTFIDCTFNQQDTDNNWSCFVLTAKNNVSTVGNKFINCTFTGVLEEGAGADVGPGATLWTVNSVSGNTVSLTMFRDAWGNRNNYGVGAHLVIQRGDGVGNYYLITERTGDTFTLSSDKFAVSDIAVGDHVSTAMAAVDNEWLNCTVYTTKNNVLRGVHSRGVDWIWGGFGSVGHGSSGQTTVVAGFSNYGSCFGNTFRDCKVIGDGWTLVGGDTGNAVEPTQVGFWERGEIRIHHASSGQPVTDAIPYIPHHTTYENCTVTGCDQAFNGGPHQYALHTGDFVFYGENGELEDCHTNHQVAEYPSSHILVDGCNFGGGQFKNWFGNVVKSRWVNTPQEPISTFDECLNRFWIFWKSDYPFNENDNPTVYDPFPTKSVNLGDQSLADFTIENTTFKNLYRNGQPVIEVYRNGQPVSEVYRNGVLVFKHTTQPITYLTYKSKTYKELKDKTYLELKNTGN